jgi:hypothetical protein
MIPNLGKVDVVDIAATKRYPPCVASELIVAFKIFIVAESLLSESCTLSSKIALITLPMVFDHIVAIMNKSDLLPIQ